jgi:hypothetical protein
MRWRSICTGNKIVVEKSLQVKREAEWRRFFWDAKAPATETHKPIRNFTFVKNMFAQIGKLYISLMFLKQIL